MISRQCLARVAQADSSLFHTITMFLSLRATRKWSSGSIATLLMEGPSTWPRSFLTGVGHSNICPNKDHVSGSVVSKVYEHMSGEHQIQSCDSFSRYTHLSMQLFWLFFMNRTEANS